jgi:MFS transporter, SP family, sugar:H+ symporter
MPNSYQFALTLGLLLAAVVNNATHARNDSGSYRIPVIIQALWVCPKVLIEWLLVLVCRFLHV